MKQQSSVMKKGDISQYSEVSQTKDFGARKSRKPQQKRMDHNEKKTKEISNEEETMQQTIQQVEKTRLERAFQILCGIPKNTNSSELALNNKDLMDPTAQSQELLSFGKADLVNELYVLLEQSEPDQKMSKQRRIEMKHEIEQIADNMIWEVDEDLDQQISWYEFELMYKRCIFDKSGLEPRSLFNLVEFLMFDKQEKKRITIEDTLELLYVKCTNYKQDSNLDAEIDDIFDDQDSQKAIEGQEKEITWKEYLEKVTQRAINQRKQKEEEIVKLYCFKKNTDSQMN